MPVSGLALEHGLLLVSFLRPDFTGQECRQVVFGASRDAFNSSMARRIKRNPAEEALKLASWQLPEDAWFYAWTLLKTTVLDPPDPRLCTRKRYIAALISAGLIGRNGEAKTPAWLTAAVLDILLQVPRGETETFRIWAFHSRGDGRLRKRRVKNRVVENPDADGSLTDRGGGAEGYARIVGDCQKRISELTGLERERGVKGRPSALLSVFGLARGKSEWFWRQFWPVFEPPSLQTNHWRPGLATGKDLNGREKAPSHEELLHLICGACLNRQMNENGWPGEVHLPAESENGECLRLPDLKRIVMRSSDPKLQKELLAELAEFGRRRETATGRVLVSVDGEDPVEWTPDLLLRPKRYLEVLRGGVVLLWHEPQQPESLESHAITEYRVGRSRYVVVEHRQGVALQVRHHSLFAWVADNDYSRRARWWRKWTPAFALCLFLIALLRPADVIRTAREEVKPRRGQLGASVTGTVKLTVDWPTLPWDQYEISVQDSKNRKITCPLIRPAERTNNRNSWRFDCGENWAILEPGEISLTLKDKRFKLIDRISPPVTLRKQSN